MANVARVGSVVASIGASIAMTVGGPIGWTIAVALIAVSIGLTYLARPELPPGRGGASGTLRAGGAVPRTFMIGERWATPGSLVYANTWGDANETPNAFLFQVIALSDLEGVGLLSLIVNGETATYDEGNVLSLPGTPLDGYIFIPEYNTDHNYLLVKFYDGTQTVADPGLVLAFGAHATHPYLSTRVGVGCPYAIVVSRVDNEEGEPWGGGFPELSFTLSGVPWYDVRKDTTAGGAGAHRWANKATWEVSSNNLVQIYNILRGITYEDTWFYGGQNMPAARLPYSYWAAAMNECDVLIDKAGGGTEPQYRAGGEIFVDSEPAAVIEELLKACNGRLEENGGIYKPHVGAVGAAVFAFDDGAIYSTEPQSLDMFPSLSETVNGVTARYVSEAENWQFKDAPPRYNADFELEDGGRRLVANATYERVSEKRQAQRLMTSALKEARRFRKHTLAMPPEARVLEPLDIVAWTSVRNGYTAKKFRLDYVEYLPNLDVILSMTEVDPSDYDWSTDDELPDSGGTIGVIKPPPQPIKDFAAIGHDEDGIAGILLSWDPDVNAINGIRFQVRRDSDDVMILDSQTDAWESGLLFISHNIAHAKDYEVRAKYKARTPRRFTWSGWLAVTTPDVAPWHPDIDEINRWGDELFEYTQGQAAYLRSLSASVWGDLSQFLAHDVLKQQVRVHYDMFLGAVNDITFAVANQGEIIAGRIVEIKAEYKGEVDAQALVMRAIIASVVVEKDRITALAQGLDEYVTQLEFDGEILGFATVISLQEAKVENIRGVVEATATSVLGLEAKVGNFTAGALIAIQATADSNSAVSRVWIKVRAEGENFSNPNDAYQAAMLLEARAQGSGGYSQVGFVADRFFIADGFSGAAKYPFLYVAGELTLDANVHISGDLFVDGEITTKGIALGAVSNAAGSVAVGPIAVAKNIGWVLLLQNSINMTDAGVGSFVDIKVRFDLLLNGNPGGVYSFRLRRNGSVIWSRSYGGDRYLGRPDGTIFAIDTTPANGANAYRLEAEVISGNPASLTMTHVTMTLFGAKR